MFLLDLHILRLCSGFEEHLLNGLSKQEGADHGRCEALGVAVLLLGCGSAALPKIEMFRVLP